MFGVENILTMDELIKIIVDSSGIVVVCFLFLHFLTKQNDKQNVVNNEFLKQVIKSTKTIAKLAGNIDNLNQSIDEQKVMIKELYLENYTKLKKIRSLEKQKESVKVTFKNGENGDTK